MEMEYKLRVQKRGWKSCVVEGLGAVSIELGAFGNEVLYMG